MFFWRFALNYIEGTSNILSDVLDGYSGFFRMPRVKLFRRFVGNFTMIFLILYHAPQVLKLDILSVVSRSINSIFCWSCQSALHRQSEQSGWILSTFLSVSHYFSRYFVGRISVNFLEFRRLSYVQITQCFAGRFTVNYLETSNI